MHPLLRFLFILLICSQLFSQNTPINTARRDSFILALKKVKHDTAKASLLVEYTRQVYAQVQDTAILLSKEALQIIDKIQPPLSSAPNVLRTKANALSDLGYLTNLQGKSKEAIELYNQNMKVLSEISMPDGSKGDLSAIAVTLSTLGLIYHQQGKATEALAHFNRSLKIREKIKMPDGKIGDKIGIAQALSNMAAIYNFQGLVKEAIECNNRSLKIKEETGDENGIATTLNNLGYIYYKQEQFTDALDKYSRSLKIYEKLGNKLGIASSLNNIGGIYKMQKIYPEALKYYERSLKLNQEINNKPGAGAGCNNIGLINSDLGNYKVALEYYNLAIAYYKEMNEPKGISNTLSNIAFVYKKQNKLNEAYTFGMEGLELAKQVGFIDNIERSAKLMSEIYELKGNGMKALEMYKLFIAMRDSSRNKENQKALFTREAKYQFEKQRVADSIAASKNIEVKNAEIEKHKTEINAKKNQQYLLIGICCVMLAFALYILNRYRHNQRQKKLIEEQKKIVEDQKHLVEEKQREIIDSIRYAKRIQTALVTSEFYITKELKKLNGKK